MKVRIGEIGVVCNYCGLVDYQKFVVYQVVVVVVVFGVVNQWNVCCLEQCYGIILDCFVCSGGVVVIVVG